MSEYLSFAALVDEPDGSLRIKKPARAPADQVRHNLVTNLLAYSGHILFVWQQLESNSMYSKTWPVDKNPFGDKTL